MLVPERVIPAPEYVMLAQMKQAALSSSQGAGVDDIVAKMEADHKEVKRDAFGHVKLDSINPGKYFADTISSMIGAEKVLLRPPH